MRAFTDNLPDRTNPETEAAIDAIWAARGEPRMYRVPAFDGACARLGVEHRLTKPYHPWTNGQVERMNRTLKDATVSLGIAVHEPPIALQGWPLAMMWHRRVDDHPATTWLRGRIAEVSALA